MIVDRVLGAGAILVAIPVAVATWGFGVGSPKSPGAGFWPLVIVVVMVGLGISLILRPGPAAASAAAAESRWGRLWIALGTMAFYVVALNPLGFPLATSVLLLVQLRWVEGRSWRSECLDRGPDGARGVRPLPGSAQGSPACRRAPAAPGLVISGRRE